MFLIFDPKYQLWVLVRTIDALASFCNDIKDSYYASIGFTVFTRKKEQGLYRYAHITSLKQYSHSKRSSDLFQKKNSTQKNPKTYSTNEFIDIYHMTYLNQCLLLILV